MKNKNIFQLRPKLNSQMKNKRGDLQISFSWIFAIVAGIFILVLSIYGVTKIIGIYQDQMSGKGAMSIKILTNPFESSFESAKRVLVDGGGEARIYTECSNYSVFGVQTVKTSQKVFNEWSEEDSVEVSMQNRYIFSKNPVEGRNFYVFSKPFEMPFKIADLIYITSTEDKYCFVDAPKDIEEELEYIIGEEPSANENFFVEERRANCPERSTIVCFRASETCDIFVSTTGKYVQKSGARMYYEGNALMYAAIFSEKQDYECQLDRLMKRTEQLFMLYKDKSDFVLEKSNCNSELDFELIEMINLLRDFSSSNEIITINRLAEEIENKNRYAECKLW